MQSGRIDLIAVKERDFFSEEKKQKTFGSWLMSELAE